MHRALDALGAFVRRVGFAQSGGEALRAPQFYVAERRFWRSIPTRANISNCTSALGANPRATLLATIDRARTAMGSRMLARWVLAPLVDRAGIAARADCVAALVRDAVRRGALQDVLHRCFDLERIAQKIRFRRVLPRDLGSLLRTLACSTRSRTHWRRPNCPRRSARCASDWVASTTLRDDIAATLVDEPPATLADGGVIRPAASAELADCVSLRGDARSRLAALEERERERSGIKSLKIKYASAFGYAIEVGKARTPPTCRPTTCVAKRWPTANAT